MRILFVLENYFPFIGGAEVLFKNLCEGLAAKGNDITIVTTLLPDTPIKETINKVTILRVRTPVKASRYWFTLLAIPISIRMAGDADIIHTTTYNGAFPAWLAARLQRKKCVITVLEIIGKHWKGMAGMGVIKAGFHQLLERVIISLPFDHYCGISNYTAECIKQLGVKSSVIQVIYPGIDYQLFDPARANGRAVRSKLGISDEFIYMYYGRPGVSKGVRYLVEAVPLISEQIKNSKLVMILAHEPSDGYHNIREAIFSAKIQGNVILIDPVPRDQLPSFIAAADCVVIPSLTEGFGFSAAEACAVGIPVVASDVGSLPEVVNGNYSLVRPGDPHDIARGIREVCDGRAVTSDHKTFPWSDCINGYLVLYNELLDQDRNNST